MKEGVIPSQNLADFCSLSFTLLSSYREPITSYAFNEKKVGFLTNLIHSEHVYMNWPFYIMKHMEKRKKTFMHISL